MAARSWGVHISGPVLALAAISLGILAALYADDPSAGVRIVRWSAMTTGALSAILIFVAQYDVWKEQKELTEQREAELEKALSDGPELSLGFNNVPLAERFYVENRGQQDAHWFPLIDSRLLDTPRSLRF